MLCLFQAFEKFRAFDLLPPDGLSLTKDSFDNDDEKCGTQDAIQAVFQTFMLPSHPEDFSMVIAMEVEQAQGVSGVVMNLEGAIFEIHGVEG